jgi:hypothetical protein
MRVRATTQPRFLSGHTILLSASIPDPDRWAGPFDAFEITDAVVAGGRSVLTAGGRLVTAAHPTIAPLLVYLASEFPPEDRAQVVVYQSALFDEALPDATKRFQDAGLGTVIWVQGAKGEEPVPGKWDHSLRIMRTRMLEEAQPSAAFFVGGMAGIREEYDMFKDMFPDRPAYPLGRPGGEARKLAPSSPHPLRDELRTGDVYPAVFRRALADLRARLE